VLRTASFFIPSAMTGFIVSVFPFRNRVSSQEAFEGLELGEGKPSRPVLRGPRGRLATRWQPATSRNWHARLRPSTERSCCNTPKRSIASKNRAGGTQIWEESKSLSSYPSVLSLLWIKGRRTTNYKSTRRRGSLSQCASFLPLQ
jgi:hypothetical protein